MGFTWFSLLVFAHSTDRAPVTLHLDGIVQVLNCHLSDMAIGMMTRIAVLKWLYHLYIKTPRKVSPASPPGGSSPPGSSFRVHLGFQEPPHAWEGLGHCTSGKTLVSRRVTDAMRNPQ